MADWKDFFEDNKEFRGQYLDSLAERKGSKGIEKTPPAPPLQFCPLCHAAFFEDIEIARHIQTIHGPQHIYLRVNGQIIRDIGWAEQGISELRLVLLGFSQAVVEIAGFQLRKALTAVGDENLKRLIPAGFEGELTLRVEPLGGNAREFTLYSRSLPQFRRGSLDALIQSCSDQDTKPGSAPDIGRWRSLTGDMGVLENRLWIPKTPSALKMQVFAVRSIRSASSRACNIVTSLLAALNLRGDLVSGTDKDAGELGSVTEPDLLKDASFGAIYYRMLLRAGPLTRQFGQELVQQLIRGHRSGNARKRWNREPCCVAATDSHWGHPLIEVRAIVLSAQVSFQALSARLRSWNWRARVPPRRTIQLGTRRQKLP
jgi:hypothetical protein